MNGASSRPSVLYLVKSRPELRQSYSGQPRECYWGLSTLRQRGDLHISPWLLCRRRFPRIRWCIEELAGCLYPRSQVFWSQSSSLLGWQLRLAQKHHDVALSVDNVATATLLALRRHRGYGPKIVCLLIRVADWLESSSSGQRERTLAYLAGADRLLALGHAEVDYLQACGLAQTRFLPFGVDTDFWSPSGEGIEDYVFAVGSDGGRDFDTLVRACPYPLKIMTRNPGLITVPFPPHVSLVQGDTARLRQLYARARLVVVPLKDRMQPSGQNTILQAMAMGKLVILTRTRGVWTDRLGHGENCIYVRPQDREDLRDAIRAAYDEPASAQAVGSRARRTACRHYGIDRLTDATAAHIHQVLAHG